ncbi:trans-sialidase [Trypanosoma cruzi]|nr:trans-sialidase [Trypanosoma cruzi]
MPAGKTRRKHIRGYSRWTTKEFASSTAEMPPSLAIGNASVWECPSPHDGTFWTECLPLLYGQPLRYSLVIVTAYSKNKTTSCFAMNVGCDSRGPTIHVVCGDFFFYCYFAFVLLCALHLLVCVCVPSVRDADTTDRSRRMCMRWSLVCRSCLLLPLPSVCRAWCAAYGACLAAALSSCGVPSVCVCRTSRLPCCSPFPHCADQLHTTERPHSR